VNVQQPGPIRGLSLEYPMSLGVFDTYQQAQRVVDYLSDNEFAVNNLAIVGTELKSMERVTGRLTRRKVAIAGATSGLWIGLFVGIAFRSSARRDSSVSCSPRLCSARCSDSSGARSGSRR